MSKFPVTIRELDSISDFARVQALEKQVWGLADIDALPVSFAVATKTAGGIWLGAFDGEILAGFAFGFLGMRNGTPIVHSHQLAVIPEYRDRDVGRILKLAQRDMVLAMRFGEMRINEINWTFDPLQSKNAHLNFAKLGVFSDIYKVDVYGRQSSSILHRNGTDRLLARWPIYSRRVEAGLAGKDRRNEVLDALATLRPLIAFDGNGAPERSDLGEALRRQRVAIEIPSDIGSIENENIELAREWRTATRWAFTESLNAGFFVDSFCRNIRGQQGPSAYLLEKGRVEEYIPEMARGSR